MNHLDLFSGIGGFSLAAQRVWGKEHNIVAFCENDKYCQKVLKKHWPNVPIIETIEELNGITQTIDLLTGGWPCQPFSVAGKRKGKEDNRYLWHEIFRIIQETKPTWIIGENVTGIINMELDNVLSDLEGERYETQTFIIPGCAVDARHRRNRVWITAYSDKNSKSNESKHEEEGQGKLGVMAYSKKPRIRSEFASSREGQSFECSSKDVPDTERSNEQRKCEQGQRQRKSGRCGGAEDVSNTTITRQQGQGLPFNSCNQKKNGERQTTSAFNGSVGAIWPVEPDVGRVAHGVSSRVDRLKALGNAIVPQVVEVIMRGIKEIND